MDQVLVVGTPLLIAIAFGWIRQQAKRYGLLDQEPGEFVEELKHLRSEIRKISAVTERQIRILSLLEEIKFQTTPPNTPVLGIMANIEQLSSGSWVV